MIGRLPESVSARRNNWQELRRRKLQGNCCNREAFC